MLPYLWIIALIAATYLVGSIPWGLIIVRWLKGVDIRTIGSRNIGATNVRRTAGGGPALMVLLLDALKGAAPVLIARWSTPALHLSGPWLATIIAVTAVVAHMFPLYLAFKPSGKGVATALGGFLVLAPWAAAGALAAYALVVAFCGKSALGSLSGGVVLAPAVWLTTGSGVLTLGAVVTVLLITLRHKENIRRLRQGAER